MKPNWYVKTEDINEAFKYTRSFHNKVINLHYCGFWTKKENYDFL